MYNPDKTDQQNRLSDHGKHAWIKLLNLRFKTIVNDVREKQFGLAFSRLLKLFSSDQKDLMIRGQGTGALKLELKLLENRMNAIDNEKMELGKLLSDFQYRHSIELGNLLLEILQFRKLLYQYDRLKYEEAEKDEKRYREQIKSDRKQQKHKLTIAESKELKKKFRKATLLCHPDKVNEQHKEAAQGMFIRLKNAYDSNDLKQVDEILTNLEKGNYFKSKSDTISENEALMAEIAKLRKRIIQFEKKVTSIKNSETYTKIVAIDDWDKYFRDTKIKLEAELEELKIQIKT